MGHEKNAAKTAIEKYRFKDEEERLQRSNRLAFLATIIMCVIVSFYLIMRMMTHESAKPMLDQVANWITMLSLIVNIVVYKNKKFKSKFRVINAASMVIVYIATMFLTNATFIFWVIAAVLVMNLPFFDWKYSRLLAVFYLGGYLLSIFFRKVTGVAQLTADGYALFATIIAVVLLASMVAKIMNIYMNDITGYMAYQQAQQDVMLKDVLNTSKVVKEESDKSSEATGQLYESAETIQRSMNEIAGAMELTAESVQNQNVMTQEIQGNIEETAKRSEKMVVVAEESNANIRENMEAIEELKRQASEIAVTNEQVNEAMQRLQLRTQEVEEIAGMIFKISSQTNLLALNASIESARAGEAGRGFAVVADQIRQLAEQTRVSTESIKNIVTELNVNANEVVGAVEKSMSATEKQNEMINTAADNFEKLDKNITTLIGGIKDIDADISGIFAANNRIVESISQLSATAEEITATAEQAKNLSNSNLQSAEEVKAAIDTIQTTSEGLEKYF